MDLAALAAQLRRTRWEWIALAAALTPLSLWVRARRWRYLFPARARPPGLVAAIMIGYMVNNVLPLRAGELARVYVVARRWGHGFWMVLATTVVERLLDGLAVVLMVSALVLLVPVPGYLQAGALLLLAVNAAGMVMLGLCAWRPQPVLRGLAWVLRRWPRARHGAERVFERFTRGLEGVRTAAHLPPLAAWTVVVWLVPAAIVWVTMRAMGLSLPAAAPWTVLAFVGLSVSIPSAPGFVGVFHAAATLALEVFGVPRAEGLGFALLLHAVGFVPVTLVGWIVLLREHMTLAEAAHAPSAAAPPAREVSHP